MRPSNPVILNAVSAVTSQASAAQDSQFTCAASFQIVSSSGSNSGSMQIQFSNDPPYSCTTDSSGRLVPTNWSNLGSAATVTSGGLTSVQLPQSTYAGYRWLRALWTPSSGAGTITINAMTLGGS